MAHRTKGGAIRVWKKEEIRQALDLCLIPRVVRELNKPLIIGEVGAFRWSDQEEQEREWAWFGNLWELLNELGVGYAGWVWHPENHLKEHGMLRDGSFFKGPNRAGQILIESVPPR
jgi:hypothetical protein